MYINKTLNDLFFVSTINEIKSNTNLLLLFKMKFSMKYINGKIKVQV